MGFWFQGKKGAQAQGFGKSTKKARKSRRSFMLEEIITPSALIPGVHDTDPLRQFLESLPLSDWNFGHLVERIWVHALREGGNSLHFMADVGGTCPTTPTPTGDLPPLVPFDPFGLTQQPAPIPGIDFQSAFDTLTPPVVLPFDPPGSTPKIQQVNPGDFPLANHPVIGIIDTGFSNNPDIDNSRQTLGRDRVSNDDNPILSADEGNQHGAFVEGIIGATRNNGIGIDGINDIAPLWLGRAIGSGKWAESLREFVDAVKKSGQPNGLVNLSLDLTQQNPDGSVITRYEFTPEERKALEYARQNRVLIVAAAGNDGGVMSVLGQASQEFDNIMTVGAADGKNRAAYSSYGRGLDILAAGGTPEKPEWSTVGDGVGTMAGTSVATAKVTGAASLVWAANPGLNYRQVVEILKSTAMDLSAPGWDEETGAGLLDMGAAVEKAKVTKPEVYNPTPWYAPETWSGEGKVTPEERAAQGGTSFNAAPLQLSPNFTDSGVVSPAQSELYHTFTVTEPGYFRYTVTRTNGSTQLPLVSVVKADGKSAGFEFIPGEASGVFNSVGVTIGDENFDPTKVQTPVSKTAAVFLDAGTYAVKVATGGWDSSIKNYDLKTELIPDQPSAFSGSAQFRIPLQNNISGMFTSASTSPELNVPVVNSSNQLYQYGIEVNEAVKFNLNSQLNSGYADIVVKKLVGLGDQSESITTYSTGESQPIDLNLNLNKGRYKIYVKATAPLNGSVTPLITDPDGSLATARNIGTLTPTKLKFSDSIGGSDRSDFYRFDVSEPSEVALYINRLQGNPNIKLLDAQGNEIDKTNNSSGTSPYDVIFNTVNPGTYYVQVFSSNNGNANYELKLDATPVASSGTPQPGGSSVSIGSSPVTNTGSGSVSIGSSPVTNTGSGSVTIGSSPVTNTGGGSVSIGASPVNQPVAPQPGQGGVPTNAGSFINTNVSNGVTTHYYTNGYLTIQPSGYQTWYDTSSTSSVATVETLGKPTQVIADADRQLGEFIGRYEYKGRLGTGDNTDDYYFTVKDRSLLNLALRNLGVDASLKLYKVDSNGSKSLMTEAPAIGQGFEKLGAKTLDTGNYYVEVNKGSGTADTDYTMVLNLAKTLNDANPNNFNGQQPNPFWGTFTGRTVISGNLSSSNPAKQSSTNGYDNDRYRLDINNLGSQSPNILRLGLNNLAPNATAKVVVYDGNNQPVKEQLFYPGQNNPLEVSGLAEGIYFVGVEQVQGDTFYNLAVQLDQAGEDWSRVRNLGDLTGLRKEYQDFVSATRDGSDYYKFTIKDSRLLQLAPRLFDSDNQADVKVELYDANQQLVTFTENNQIYNADLAAGDYYVKVVPGSGNDTNYRLVVNLTAPGIVNAGNVTYSYNDPLFPDSSSSSAGSNANPPANNQSQSNNNPAINLVNFIGSVMHPDGILPRQQPTFTSYGGTLKNYGTWLNFDAWTYGESVNDYQLGTPDNRWFRIAGTNYWVPSAVIYGNPEGLPGNQQPNSTNNSGSGYTTATSSNGKASQPQTPSSNFYPDFAIESSEVRPSFPIKITGKVPKDVNLFQFSLGQTIFKDDQVKIEITDNGNSDYYNFSASLTLPSDFNEGEYLLKAGFKTTTQSYQQYNLPIVNVLPAADKAYWNKTLDQRYEEISKVDIYKEEKVEIGQNIGNYVVSHIFGDWGKNGFYALGLVSNDGKSPPILVCRGTQPSDQKDISSDLFPQGIGLDQFESFKKEIKDWLQEMVNTIGKPDITGHSLGGALAQRIAANFPDLVGKVVTFNSPGIDSRSVNLFRQNGGNADKVFHYVVDGDLVSYGGQEFLPGKAIKISESPLNEYANIAQIIPILDKSRWELIVASLYLIATYENHVEKGLLGSSSRGKTLLPSDALNEQLRNNPFFENVRVNAGEWSTEINKNLENITNAVNTLTPNNIQQWWNGYVNDWNNWANGYQNGGVPFP